MPLKYTSYRGPGLLESIYEACLIDEMKSAGLIVKSQIYVPVHYKGKDLGGNLKLDLIVKYDTALNIFSTALNNFFTALNNFFTALNNFFTALNNFSIALNNFFTALNNFSTASSK